MSRTLRESVEDIGAATVTCRMTVNDDNVIIAVTADVKVEDLMTHLSAEVYRSRYIANDGFEYQLASARCRAADVNYLIDRAVRRATATARREALAEAEMGRA